MRIATLPRESMAQLPTPLTPMPRFTSLLAGPDIWVKRDDQTGLATGGNKARKLEFIMGEAIQVGADVVVTAGGPQSNHARMTAAAAARSGLGAVLCLGGEDPGIRQGNLLLDELLGADIVFAGEQNIGEVMEETAARLREQGMNPYIVPVGGSVPTGCVGYVLAGLEMHAQATEAGLEVDHLVVSSGSGGTAAGLLVALARVSPSTTLHAVTVSRSAHEVRDRILGLARDTARLLEVPGDGIEGCLEVHDEFYGEGYAIPTPEGVEAGLNLARTEGILVDTTYTAKGLAGLVGLVKRGRFDAGEAVVFLHTGGVPAVFEEARRGTFDGVWRE